MKEELVKSSARLEEDAQVLMGRLSAELNDPEADPRVMMQVREGLGWGWGLGLGIGWLPRGGERGHLQFPSQSALTLVLTPHSHFHCTFSLLCSPSDTHPFYLPYPSPSTAGGRDGRGPDRDGGQGQALRALAKAAQGGALGLWPAATSAPGV